MVAWPSVWAFSTEIVFMFHLLQIIAVFVGFLAYIIDLKVCPKCIFFQLMGSDWVEHGFLLCHLYNMTHALILLFLHLPASVFYLVFSVRLSVHPLLEASLGWLNGICVVETGDEFDVREVVIQEIFCLYNFKNSVALQIITLNNLWIIYLGQIVY